MNRYQDLRVWQKSMDLVVQVYKVTSLFPESEKFGLTSQINRSAVSIPSNIAEGSNRNSPKEFYHFLGIAKGSLAELETQIDISRRLDLISGFDYDSLFALSTYVGKMITRLQISIKNSDFNGISEPLEYYNHDNLNN